MARWQSPRIGCEGCDCNKCLYRWSGRCPYGTCYDDHAARVNPFDKWSMEHDARYAHWASQSSDGVPWWRKGWSDWNKPGEQGHWCRGGTFWAQTGECEHFVEYDRAKTEIVYCLEAVTSEYQDGYIQCSLIDLQGCEECYKRFNEKLEMDG